jgi:hypothetical protein
MTAVAEGRERASLVAPPILAPSVPEHLSDQAMEAPQSDVLPPGSGFNGQQPKPAARSEEVAAAGSNGQGRAEVVSATEVRAPAPAYRELRVFAELYADVQQTRIACENRAERGGLDPIILGPYFKGLAQTEHQLKLALGRCYRRVVDPSIREWQQATIGIGEHTLARLLGAIGHPRHATPHHWEGDGDNRVLIADPPFERNVAKLWAYCGHGDPARRRRKGMTAEDGAALGNPRAKMLTYLLAEACMKCVGSAGSSSESVDLAPTRARSPYRDVYDQAKAVYADRTDEDGKPWPPARYHAAALRRVGKEILRDLWLAAGDHRGPDALSANVPGGHASSDTQSCTAAGEHHQEEASTTTT